MARKRSPGFPCAASFYHADIAALAWTTRLRNKSEVRPRSDEPVIGKNVNSAFIGTDLEARLRAMSIDTVVIAGLTTAHCVSTTTRMAGNLGFKVFLAADACATNAQTGHDGKTYDAETVHALALASLHGEFAEVVDTFAILDAIEQGDR